MKNENVLKKTHKTNTITQTENEHEHYNNKHYEKQTTTYNEQTHMQPTKQPTLNNNEKGT